MTKVSCSCSIPPSRRFPAAPAFCSTDDTLPARFAKNRAQHRVLAPRHRQRYAIGEIRDSQQRPSVNLAAARRRALHRPNAYACSCSTSPAPTLCSSAAASGNHLAAMDGPWPWRTAACLEQRAVVVGLCSLVEAESRTRGDEREARQEGVGENFLEGKG